MVRYALLTVSDRTGLEDFAHGLEKLDFSLIASEGTSRYLEEHNIKSTKVEAYTGQRAVMQPQGIKLIHPKIFGGILADLDNPSHVKDLSDFGIFPFEIVACNFYPFEKDAKIMNIDIGGPAMARCAAKNYKRVAVVTDPADYGAILEELEKKSSISAETRLYLAKKAFRASIKHDEEIISFLDGL